MKISAHRGYSGRYPENTMLAFEKAAEAGADEIELDIQLSKDGQVVVFHDETLERLTGHREFLRNLSFEELRKLNAAQCVYGDKFGVNPIPSLDEYFEWVKNTEIVTNIELKNGRFYYEGLEEKTIALISTHKLEAQVFFSSFNHTSLLKCKKLNPAIRCGALIHATLVGNAGYYVQSNGLDFFHPDINSLDEEMAQSCAKYGVEINVWTVNDMNGLLKAQSLKCRGIITNFPDVCKAYLKNQ
jgi:glycerophosphoryl diester phosphodiesterase